MSKGYNMAGWRVGFAAGNRDMLNALKAIKGYYDYGIFQAVQIAAIVALRHGEPGRLAQVAEYQHAPRRAGRRPEPPRLERRDARRPACSSGPRSPSPGGRRLGSIDFAMKLLEEAEVAVSPGRGFGESRRGLPPPRPDRERAAAPAGRPPDRPLPQDGKRRQLRRVRTSLRQRRPTHVRLCLLRAPPDL